MAKQVLIMEDEMALQKLIAMIVEKAGASPVAFDDGIEGLEWIDEGNVPDLVLVDLMMPRKNGIEVIEGLRDRGLSGHIPIILLTGSFEEKLVLRGIAAGAKDYLSKPFTPQALIERIHKYLPTGSENS